MAAIAYRVSTRGYRYRPRRPPHPHNADRLQRHREAPYLHLVEPVIVRHPVAEPRASNGARACPGPDSQVLAVRRARPRFGAALLTVGMLIGLWFGAGALTSTRSVRLVEPAGARAVHGGFRYVARPGDTVWSIASAMEPGADPRPLVDQLDAELDGGVLRAGTVLLLP